MYQGTASVGDFMTVSIDPDALTITYTNHSNADSATIPYSVNTDGSYTLADPEGNLIAAYEVPNYALLIEAAKTGPNHDTPALITAVNSTDISLSTFTDQAYNYMQFRTRAGGVQIGAISVDSEGLSSTTTFWPSGMYFEGGTAFGNGTMDLGDGRRRYFFVHNCGSASPQRFGPGTLYVLPPDTFEAEPPLAGAIDTAHLVSRVPVRPLARVAVTPADFPFRDRIRYYRDGEPILITLLRA